MKKITAKFPGKKILVAEDYFVNQEVTRDILEMMECSVDIAENGEEALKMYQENPYDLILMDIQMPEKDGYEVTRFIREQEAGQRRIPIIALTANALNGDREECLKQGMDDYISKPLDASKLEELIKKHIGN
jgi:CheY-like chemotaxis protein